MSAQYQYNEIIVEIRDRVATVMLNRPARMNAITPPFYNELRAALGQVDKDDGVRAIVITGAGKGFCSGADAAYLADRADGKDPAAASRTLSVDPNVRADFQQRWSFPAGLSKPVIAAVNGPAVGAGLLLALACDIRIASTQASFMTGFSRLGLGAENGAAWLLVRLLGRGRASDLLFSSRKIDGIEAERIGLVERVVEPKDLIVAAQDYAAHLANMVSPRSLRIIKRQIWEAPNQSLGDVLLQASKETEESFASQDFGEGSASLREKRPPNFTGK